MDAAVSELRAHLSDYLDRVREGDEIVITDRGVPIARLLGLTAPPPWNAWPPMASSPAPPLPRAPGRSGSPPPAPPSSRRPGQRPAALTYFDSSALVKLLVAEEGSDLAADLRDNCDAALASRLAYPEVRAALAAVGRNLDRQHQRP